MTSNNEKQMHQFPHNFAIKGGPDRFYSRDVYDIFKSLGAKNLEDKEWWGEFTPSARYYYLTSDYNVESATRFDSQILNRFILGHVCEYNEFVKNYK